MATAVIGALLLIALVRLAEHWAEVCVFVAALLLARHVLKSRSVGGGR